MTSPSSQQTPSADDFLLGGGVPSAKFPTIGTSVAGRITDKPTVSQQTDFTTGDPLVWNDGAPRMQLMVTLATDQRDDADDDGVRRIYVKGQLKKAVADAVRKANARGLEVGGVLAVTYVRDGEKTNPRFNAPKEYQAEYTPAAAAELNTADPAETVATSAGQVNTTTGEITAAAAPAAGDGALDPNDPKVKALLQQLQGGNAASAAAGGTPPF